MAEYLFINLRSDAHEPSWVAVDSDGRMLGAIASGPLERAAGSAANRKVVLLVPGSDVVTTQAIMPAMSQSRMRQTLPFSIEDAFADDIEDLMFAVGPRMPSGKIAVSVVGRKKLDDWLGQAAAAGIVPSAVYAETDGVPDVPSTLSLILDDGRMFGRRPGEPPIALEGLSLSQAFELLTASEDEESEVQHALVYIDERSREERQAELALIESRLSSLSVRLLEHGTLPSFASKLVNEPGTNLLQGAYAPKSDWASLLQPWRLAAAMIAGFALISLVAMGAEYLSLRLEDGRLSAALGSECQAQFGSAQLSQCETRVRDLLRAAGETDLASNEGFLSTLGTLAAYADSDKRFQMLSYRNQIMSLQMVAQDVAALDEFSQQVTGTGRFEVTIQSTNPDDDRVEGRLQIVSAP